MRPNIPQDSIAIIRSIQNWYKKNCNDEWEHQYGIKIETLDNPGWSVEIDLKNTSCEHKIFKEVKIDKNEDDWIVCKVTENKFFGNGDSEKLEKILRIFLDFVSKERK